MTDRQLPQGSSFAEDRPSNVALDAASRSPAVERGGSPAPLPAIAFSVLELASWIERWSAPPAPAR